MYRNGVQIADADRPQLPRRRRATAGSATASSAVDDQNQESAVAGPAPVSVGDTAPPTVPTTLAATVTAGQVKLTWAASTDDLAVTGYRVYRGAALLTRSP